ncbi:MAG: hypothetical protein EXS18_05435 [Verrucomicrobiae bacterium]|nr:hypothetical protein [Verrucomicrobiae bacterium]
MANEESNEKTSQSDASPQAAGFRRSRKFAISLNTLLIIVLAAAITGMVNYVSIRHYKRMDWTSSGYYSVSDKTVQLLKTIKEPIQVIVFFQPSQEVYDEVKNLLREYQDKTDKLQVEYIDPNRNIARTRQLAEEFQVSEANVVIFARGEGANRKSKYVTSSEIIEYDNSGAMMGRPPQKKAFKGEQAFTSAIQNVLESKQPSVYFLTGHGEGDPEGFDEQFGCSMLGSYLKRENLKVSKLNLATSKEIPSDCDVLVVAGPTKLPVSDLEVLDRYLQNKGRMMVLLDSQKESGMNGLLQNWGVAVANDQVIGIFSLGGMKVLSEAIGLEYNLQQPIVKKLADQNTTFPLCRSLEVEAASRSLAPDRPRATWLIKSHDQFWGETDIANIKKPKFDLNADKKGPLILAAAVESGNLPGSDVTLPSTRMVVVGSSLFISNGELPNSPANLDFFLNSVNWLINKPERVMGISPKMPREFRLSLSEPQLQTLKLSLIVGLPGCVAVIGAFVWWRRRK